MREKRTSSIRINEKINKDMYALLGVSRNVVIMRGV